MNNQRNIIVTLECFVKKGGKYLMLHRSDKKRILPGVWLAPGGKREFNEGLFECARREIFEETGLRIKNIKIRAAGNAYMGSLDQEVFFHMLTADYDNGELVSEADNGELTWLTPEEILKLDSLLAELKQVLPHIVSDDPKVISYKSTYQGNNEMIEFKLEEAK